MNNLSRFDRNKILFNSEYPNILSPSSLYFQKNKTFIEYNQEEGKSDLILNDKHNNMNSYTTKNSKGINLMFDYKSNINKKRKQTHFFNYTNHQSPNRLNFNNKKMNKREENKNENLYSFKKVNLNKTSGRFTETNNVFNKPSSNIIAKYFSNNKILKTKQNFSINFNLNSPNVNNNNTHRNTNVGRNKKLNKDFRTSSNSNMKYQSFSNINELTKKMENETYSDNMRFSLGNNLTKDKDIYDRNNPNLNIRSSSNTYLNTENNINSRNISTKKLHNMHNKNYNLMNVDYSNERSNTYSNLISNKSPKDNDIKRQNSQQNKNNNQYKNFKFSFKTKDAYICKENRMNKKSLKLYYEEAFNEMNKENNKNLINIEKNEYKFNNEDLYYKEYLSTDHSTCTNEINKVNEKETKKKFSIQKQFMNKNSQNPEMFHFYMVSYLQKGKKVGNEFN